MKLWDKGSDVDKKVENFLGFDLMADQAQVKYECIASAVHAKMLHKIGILSEHELNNLIKGLKEIIVLNENNKFVLTAKDEDVHTKVENYLVNKDENSGKKIHTYRSRNDQLLVNARLMHKELLVEIIEAVIKLTKTMIKFAKKYEFVSMPGYTHRQKAMLSSVGLWMGAFAESLIDDLKSLKLAYQLNDQCPLGSAASYGVPKKIDREYVAELLGFSKVQNNVLYCQNSRGKIESVIVSGLSQIMLTLSKLSADIILFSTKEFGYLIPNSKSSTGSSIMPQKINPDIPETVKGYASAVIGFESIIKNAIKDLPSGYNKETKIVKRYTLQSFELTKKSLTALNEYLTTLTVNTDNCKSACSKEIFAVDHACDLVENGLSFRDAYKKTAKELNKIKIPDLGKAIKKRNHVGGLNSLGLENIELELKEINNYIANNKQSNKNKINRLLR